MIFMSPDYRNAELHQTYVDDCKVRVARLAARPPPDRVSSSPLIQWWWEPIGKASMGKYLTATRAAVVCQLMKK